MPGAGPQIDFTANHAVVAGDAARASSARPNAARPAIGSACPRRSRLQRGDRVGHQRRSSSASAAALEDPEETRVAAAQIVERMRTGIYSLSSASARTTRSSALRLLDRPSRPDAVAEDGHLHLGRPDHRSRLSEELTWLGRTAARGQVMLHVLQLDDAVLRGLDGARSRPTPGRDQVALHEEGLDRWPASRAARSCASSPDADIAFNRLALELSGYYLLSFEPEAGDRDGKPHKIKVAVPGTIRASRSGRAASSAIDPAAHAKDRRRGAGRDAARRRCSRTRSG